MSYNNNDDRGKPTSRFTYYYVSSSVCILYPKKMMPKRYISIIYKRSNNKVVQTKEEPSGSSS